MSLSSIYLSMKELLADNLNIKGVTANKNEGLTTLINKVLSITAGLDKLYYIIEDKYDVFINNQIDMWDGLKFKIEDGANGTSTYETFLTDNNKPACKRTVIGWSNHEIVDVSNHLNDIDISNGFYIQTDFYTQDGFEQPGLYVASGNEFYQIFMDSNGSYHNWGHDKIHYIKVGLNKFIDDNYESIDDFEIIRLNDIHRMKITFIADYIIFELKTLSFDFIEEGTYSYVLKTNNFIPTQLGLVFGLFGSYDGAGNVIVFNNVEVGQLG